MNNEIVKYNLEIEDFPQAIPPVTPIKYTSFLLVVSFALRFLYVPSDSYLRVEELTLLSFRILSLITSFLTNKPFHIKM